jgi:hypothetical protein
MSTLHYEGDGNVLQIVSDILKKHGYPDGAMRYAMDGGPGWSSWYYWIDVEEDPARPVEAEIEAALAARR